jgi:hypothetical protein
VVSLSCSTPKRCERGHDRQPPATGRPAGADDATQQETAEWLGSWTVVLIGSLQHLRALGDPTGVDEFREHVRKLIREPDLLGADLTQIRLTKRGIARR